MRVQGKQHGQEKPVLQVQPRPHELYNMHFRVCWADWSARLPQPPQAFADLLAGGEQFDAPMDETYQALSVDPSSVNTLESYLSEYFNVVLKKLKDVGATPKQQSDFYI